MTGVRITESQLRQIIREELLSEASSRQPVRTFLRFGDPRVVKGGVSVIHDPEAYAYAEEPGLYGLDSDVPRNLRSEAGISAYPVISISPERVVLRVANGVGTFSRQLGGFLLDRVIGDDAWLFQGRAVAGVRGTDGEPLIDAQTIKGVRQVPTAHLWVTDLDTDDPARDASRAERLLDLLDPWDLAAHHDMGYDEFFKRKGMTRQEIEDYVSGLRARFTTDGQRAKLDALERDWLAQWDEEHG